MYTFTIALDNTGKYYRSIQRFNTTEEAEAALIDVTELFNLNGWELLAAFIHQA